MNIHEGNDDVILEGKGIQLNLLCSNRDFPTFLKSGQGPVDFGKNICTIKIGKL